MNARVTTPKPPPFKLNPGQVEAMNLLTGPQRRTLLVGGARSGKTFLFIRSIVIRALRAPGSRHLLARARFNACRASFWLDTYPKVMRTCFPGVVSRPNRADGFEVLPGGSEIWFGGLDDKERIDKILGTEFATLYLGEASQIAYTSRVVVGTRLAQVVRIPGTNAYLPQREYVDLNPGGSAHWTHREFFEHVDGQDRKPLPDPENYRYCVINPEDNAENLDPATLQAYRNLPPRQRKRFYEGVYQPEVEGALWPFDVLAKARVRDDPLTPDQFRRMQANHEMPSMLRVVVAIDPSGTRGEEGKRSDEVGIIVAGKTVDGTMCVLADLTVNAPPEVWGRIAVTAYHEWQADRIVAEQNFGGAMVEFVIRSHDQNVSYVEVVASRGKAVRAEPVSTHYALGHVEHWGLFTRLEDQLLNFSTAGYMGDRSPDRADALIWAGTDLMLEEDGAAIWAELARGRR